MIRYEDIKIRLIAVNAEVMTEVCGDPCSEAIWYLDKVADGEACCVY